MQDEKREEPTFALGNAATHIIDAIGDVCAGKEREVFVLTGAALIRPQKHALVASESGAGPGEYEGGVGVAEEGEAGEEGLVRVGEKDRGGLGYDTERRCVGYDERCVYVDQAKGERAAPLRPRRGVCYRELENVQAVGYDGDVVRRRSVHAGPRD